MTQYGRFLGPPRIVPDYTETMLEVAGYVGVYGIMYADLSRLPADHPLRPSAPPITSQPQQGD